MAGSLTTTTSNKALDHLHGKTAWSMPTAHVGLFTAMPTDAGGGTEVSGGSYARVTTAGVNWAAASANSGANAADFQFPAATADWGWILGAGLFDAPTAGNLMSYGWLVPSTGGPFVEMPFTADAADLITCPGHGFAADNLVVFTNEYGGTLPAGMSVNTLYYVIASGLTANVFKVATTLGGGALDLTAVGNGMARRVERREVKAGDTFKIGAGLFVDYLT